MGEPIGQAERRPNVTEARHKRDRCATHPLRIRYGSATAGERRNSVHGPMHLWCGPQRIEGVAIADTLSGFGGEAALAQPNIHSLMVSYE